MEKRQEYAAVKIKQPLFRLLDRIRLLGSLVARETMYPESVCHCVFPTPNLYSPVVEASEYATTVKSQLPQELSLPWVCNLILWKYDSRSFRLKVRFIHTADEADMNIAVIAWARQCKSHCACVVFICSCINQP